MTTYDINNRITYLNKKISELSYEISILNSKNQELNSKITSIEKFAQQMEYKFERKKQKYNNMKLNASNKISNSLADRFQDLLSNQNIINYFDNIDNTKKCISNLIEKNNTNIKENNRLITQYKTEISVLKKMLITSL